MVIDESEDPVDELLSLVVAHFTKREVTAEMIVAVGVAPGTTERTFTGDFDRERRCVASQDTSPRAEYPLHRFTIA